MPSSVALTNPGQDLPLVEADDRFLVRADLMEARVVVARVEMAPDRFDVALGIRAADD